MSKEMQQNPADEENDCFRTVAQTNALLLDMADFAQYPNGGFDIGTAGEKLQITNLKYMEEIEKCGYGKFLIAFDTMANNIPQLAASVSNLVTQVGTGWTNSDTSVFLATDKFEACYNNDWDIE